MSVAPTKFPWRRLLLVLIGHALAVLLMGAIVQSARPWLDPWFNTPVLWSLHSLKTETLDRAVQLISLLGRGELIALLAALVLLCLRQPARRARLGTHVVGTALLVLVGKGALFTLRPHLWAPIEETVGSSFPSSHAALALSLALGCAVLLPQRLRKSVGLGLVTLAIAIGLSRLYLGVHHPTDVLLTWVWVTSWAAWVQRCLRPTPPAPATPTND